MAAGPRARRAEDGRTARMTRGIRIEVALRRGGGRERAGITEAVRATLRRERCTRAALSVAIVDDATIADLHARYLHIDGPTDVLSFDLSDEADDPHERGIDGEVVVSYDTARREARARGLTLRAELLRYVIHGTLHLLGHRDDTPRRRAGMRRVEDEVLESLGPTPARRAGANSRRRRVSAGQGPGRRRREV